jgi:hypothetical protein
LIQERQKAVLSQRKRGIEFLSTHPHPFALEIHLQATDLLLKNNRRSGLSPHKGQLAAQGDGDLVSILQEIGSSQFLAIDKGAIPRVKVFQNVLVSIQPNAGMLARYLPIWNNQAAAVVTPDDQFWLVDKDPFARFGPLYHQQHGYFGTHGSPS